MFFDFIKTYPTSIVFTIALRLYYLFKQIRLDAITAKATINCYLIPLWFNYMSHFFLAKVNYLSR